MPRIGMYLAFAALSVCAIQQSMTGAHGQVAAQKKVDCTLAGEWHADNGDILSLGGESKGGGTFFFFLSPNSVIKVAALQGGYRIEGIHLHLEGFDSSGERQLVTLRVLSAPPVTSTLRIAIGDDKDAPEVIFQRVSTGLCP